ncbi:MAG: hypothetical protein J6Y37_03660 [Paludibacteraceae bacterium]|nr:hypothetical protein [Paludibacteraceae bacterium]
MNKRRIKLTESDLHRIVKEALDAIDSKGSGEAFTGRKPATGRKGLTEGVNPDTPRYRMVSDYILNVYDVEKIGDMSDDEMMEWAYSIAQNTKVPVKYAFGVIKHMFSTNESRIRSIVREAILNELDPRTYASYAQKRQAQGQNDRQ